MVKKKTTKKKGGAVSKRRINVRKTIAKFNKNASKKPYCGSKPAPAGRPRGSSNYCFRVGLKSGFKAGIDKGKKQGEEIGKRKSVATSAAAVATALRDKTYITKPWFRDNGMREMSVTPMRALGRALNIPSNVIQTNKQNLFNAIMRKSWNRISTKKVLLR